MNYIKNALVASISVALVACGAGSGASGSTAPASTTIAAPASTTTPTSTTTTASTTTPSSGSAVGGVHFLYTSSIDTSPSGSIVNGTATYAIGANGVLTLSSSIASGSSDYMDFNPSGKFAYISSDNGERENSTETIHQYSVATDGSLMPLAVPTLTTDIISGWSSHIVFDPSGKFAFVAGQKGKVAGVYSPYDSSLGANTLYFPETNSVIETYEVNANGALSLISTLTLPSTPTLPTIAGITVNPVTNTLSAVTWNMNTDSSGAVTTQADSTITTYRIGSNGSLIAVGSPVALAANLGSAQTITFDPSGKFAYANTVSPVTSAKGYIYEFTVASNGVLTPMAKPYVAVGIDPVQVVVDTSGKYAYVANLSSDFISQFTIGKNGALTPMAVPTVYAAQPATIGLNPTGGNIYVGSANTPNITTYSIGSNGALTAGTVTNTADSTTAVGLVSFITTH